MIPLASDGIEKAAEILLWLIVISVGISVALTVITLIVMGLLVAFGVRESLRKPKRR